ncbi:MAG: bifunctional adenosylcobinamide kinase/adenosylcobinamide-phosphate guanylyltransferase [Chloroflexi bacterium]|nr:bifunctional adenosylcobinamide kinase/adenosylcobinamide-phosphate guanylyltransferase [Chloroflexota bacterium]
MGNRLTLILGGARSGKSAHAQQLAAERGKAVLYVATAEAGDEEMAARIATHRTERPAHWQTLEAPTNVGQAIRDYVSRQSSAAASQTPPPTSHFSPPSSHVPPPASPDLILLDCLTLLANNVVVPLPEPVSAEAAEAALDAELDGLLAAYAESRAEWIVISNEVGLGLVPPYPLGRAYRDALGRANQRLAAEADEVFFMVAGLAMRVKGAR